MGNRCFVFGGHPNTGVACVLCWKQCRVPLTWQLKRTFSWWQLKLMTSPPLEELKSTVPKSHFRNEEGLISEKWVEEASPAVWWMARADFYFIIHHNHNLYLMLTRNNKLCKNELNIHLTVCQRGLKYQHLVSGLAIARYVAWVRRHSSQKIKKMELEQRNLPPPLL